MPPDVGGRFSVLSPVGLLPAALVGIDIEGLLQGARLALDRAEPERSPAQAPARSTRLSTMRRTSSHGAGIHVLMPYTDRLRELAEWYRQLWAESLGKRSGSAGKDGECRPHPGRAVGATDQHSQVQLFMEGPYNKVITFMAVEDLGEEVKIPAPSASGVEPALPADLAYLPGHTLGELLQAEYEATSAALAQMGRMNCTLRLPGPQRRHRWRDHHVLPARHRICRGMVRDRSRSTSRASSSESD